VRPAACGPVAAPRPERSSSSAMGPGAWPGRRRGPPAQLRGCVAGVAAPCAAGSDFGPAWSPDGTTIAFARGYTAVGKNDRPIFVMHADGTDQHRPTPDLMPVGVPAWR
jgi:hypothetical protein